MSCRENTGVAVPGAIAPRPGNVTTNRRLQRDVQSIAIDLHVGVVLGEGPASRLSMRHAVATHGRGSGDTTGRRLHAPSMPSVRSRRGASTVLVRINPAIVRVHSGARPALPSPPAP